MKKSTFKEVLTSRTIYYYFMVDNVVLFRTQCRDFVLEQYRYQRSVLFIPPERIRIDKCVQENYYLQHK